MDLAGKHALVTGGGSGVGAAIAVALVKAGANVTIAGRTEAPLEALARSNESIHAVTCDVTDSGSVTAAFAVAVAQFGPVDIAVANAGTAESVPFAKMTQADLDDMLGVNLTGVFNTWHAALAGMKSAGWGRMIAVASTAGLRGYPYVSGYAAAKHGVVGLTRSLAQELAKTGITVNAICPGFTETPLLARSIDRITEKTGLSRNAAAATLMKDNPQGRFIQPEEIAATVLWLCTNDASSINGAALPLTGGEL